MYLKHALFVVCWLFIGFVSSVDTGITHQTHTCLKENEENPIARAILYADNWQAGRFLAIKMFATILVLGFLALAYRYKPNHTLVIAIAVAVFQAILIIYILT